ncbi:MAG: helix-turn-helix transcriptional regulator [Ruminococcaceae bacterium]|nr:helix-turn-helix transcriptional regulator [Oscillospiraceae bacterium]
MPEEKIGDKIRRLRSECNMTQKELADLLDISPSAIGMYEQNRRIPDADSIIRLAGILGVSTDYLLGYEKAAQSEQPLTSKQKKVLHLAQHLSDEDMRKLIDYAELLKKADNQ